MLAQANHLADISLPTKECPKCQRNYDPDQGRHLCYIQPLHMMTKQRTKGMANRQQEAVRYIFFDIEACQDKPVMINGAKVEICYSMFIIFNFCSGIFQCYKHEANLLVCEILCRNCMDEGIDPTAMPVQRATLCNCGVFGQKCRFRSAMCEAGNPRLLAFDNFDDSGRHPVDRFLDFILDSGPRTTTSFVIAHNGAKYDLHILLEFIYKRKLEPKLTMTGANVYFKFHEKLFRNF